MIAVFVEVTKNNQFVVAESENKFERAVEAKVEVALSNEAEWRIRSEVYRE